MGGGLSVTNSTEKRIVVQLEQNPVSIRYWGYVEPGETNRVWKHAIGDPLNTGFFIMRVIDVNSLPSSYQPPSLLMEQIKAAGFAILGIAGLGATGIIGASFLINGWPNWKSPQWLIPPGSTTEHREVWNPVYIWKNTCYNVAESNHHLVLEKVRSNEIPQAAIFAHESPDLDITPQPRRKHYPEDQNDADLNSPHSPLCRQQISMSRKKHSSKCQSEEKLRSIVCDNVQEFIQHTNWEYLVTQLVSRQLLDDADTDFLLSDKPHQKKGNYFYLQVIKHKGHDAYTRLYVCLVNEKQHLGHSSLVDLINSHAE